MRRNFVAQFIKLLKHCLSDLWSGIVTKNWAHYIDQHWLQALQFSVHLISLLSMLLGCDGSTRIQKAVVDQMGSRPPNSDYDFFGVQVWLWEVLWSCFSVQPLSWSSLVAYKILFVVCHNPVEKWFTVVAQNKRRQHFKMMIVFWFSVSS